MVQDLWDAYGVTTESTIPELTENNFWVFNNTKFMCDDLVYHVTKVNNVTQEYAITLYSDGTVADGFHRILNAKVNGITKVNVRKLVIDPQPVHVVSTSTFLNLYST
jgi:hypothetical protein